MSGSALPGRINDKSSFSATMLFHIQSYIIPHVLNRNRIEIFAEAPFIHVGGVAEIVVHFNDYFWLRSLTYEAQSNSMFVKSPRLAFNRQLAKSGKIQKIFKILGVRKAFYESFKQATLQRGEFCDVMF